MASLAHVVRLAGVRAMSTSARRMAASSFAMPALSPTMTEGGIARWNVKEGQSFAAGDVLLEIETDKATMDVEAQDDGILVKIVHSAGSKGVQVGTQIAVMAEAGDDLATLEMPAESSPAKAAPEAPKKESAPATSSSTPGSARVYTSRPLLPSVSSLVHEHHIDPDTLAQIKPTGPNGRLLKGDVLAYLGSINKDTPARLAANFDKLAHLDLSNIKVAAPKPAPKKEPAKPAVPEPPAETELTITVNWSRYDAACKENKALAALSVEDYLLCVAQEANYDIPPLKPSSNDLFNDLVGTPTRPGYANFTPFITCGTLKHATDALSKPSGLDIIDILAGKKAPKRVVKPADDSLLDQITVNVPTPEVPRALIFLKRVKEIVEEMPEACIYV